MGFTQRDNKDLLRVIWGLYWDNIRVVLGFYKGYIRDDVRYPLGLYRDYIRVILYSYYTTITGLLLGLRFKVSKERRNE